MNSLSLALLARLEELGSGLYVFGVGLAGKWLVANLPIPVRAFIDTDEKKVGQVFDGVPVLSLSMARKVMDHDSRIVVTVVDLQDVMPHLATLPHARMVALGSILDGQKVTRNTTGESNAFVEYALQSVESCHKASLGGTGLFMRSIDLVITEKCSLRCKDCANLMQYFKLPVNVPFDELIRDFDTLMERVSHIYEVRLIGGEPFMNKDIYKILRHIVDHPKLSRVVIYSNAMIPFKEAEADVLSHHKVLFSLTDYGHLARNTPRIIETLKAIGATYRLHPPENWTDSGTVHDFVRSPEEMTELFSNCCGKNLTTVSAGQLYRCPFAANADRLHAVPHDAANSVAVSASEDAIKRYVTDIPYLPACNYCKGRSFTAPEIVPAIQAPAPLPYVEFAQ